MLRLRTVACAALFAAAAAAARGEEYIAVATGECLKNEIGNELEAGGTLCVSNSSPNWCYHTYDGWKPKAPLVITALNDPASASHDAASIIAMKVLPRCLVVLRSDRTQVSQGLHADLNAATAQLADVYTSAPESAIALKAVDDDLRSQLQKLRADLEATRQELQTLKPTP